MFVFNLLNDKINYDLIYINTLRRHKTARMVEVTDIITIIVMVMVVLHLLNNVQTYSRTCWYTLTAVTILFLAAICSLRDSQSIYHLVNGGWA